MNKILTYLKVLAIPFLTFLILPLIISIFNLFGLQISKIILILISSIVMIFSGFLIGRKTSKKGFISGAILGIAFILFLIIWGFFLRTSFNLSRIIYYVILILSTMLGSIIGINKKKSN